MIYLATLTNDYGLQPGTYSGEWLKKEVRVEGSNAVLPMSTSVKAVISVVVVVEGNLIDIYEGIKAEE